MSTPHKAVPAASAMEGAVAEIRRLSEAIAEGRLNERGCAAGFTGPAASLIELVNRMLDAVVGPLRVAAGSLEEIAAGRIPQFIVAEYRGEFDDIKRSVNTFLATMYGMHHELEDFVAAIQAGKLAARANDWDYEGKWRELLGGLNGAIDAFVAPFDVAAGYLNRISRGDIPERIADRYRGDFNEIKRSLNMLIGAVDALVRDAHQLCSAAIAGQLATRVDASHHGGDFRRIVDGVNQAMDAVVGPLSRSAAVMGKVAAGDLTAELDGEHQGDFAALQRDINAMVKNLRSSMLQIAENAAVLASSSRQLAGIGQRLTATAGQTTLRANETSVASKDVAGNVQAVVAGSDAMASSIQQIAGQAADAARETSGAVAVADASNQTITRLGESSKNIGRIIQVIESISAQTGTLATGAERQAAGAGEAGRGFAVVADEVKKLAGQIRDATEAVDDRMKQMQSVLDAMDGAQLSELAQHSRQVRKATQVISTLAWQSHLLALNASIEAARAGAAGQNFSAVALEVKDLSGRTAQAAGDVRGQLEAIQGDGGQAVAGIREIAGMVQRIDSISGTISAAVKTQVSATGEMGRNLAAAAERTRAIVSHAADVAAAAQTTTEVAGETERAAAGLSEMADRLNALVGSFRL